MDSFVFSEISFGFYSNMVRRIRHRLHPQQLRRAGRHRFSHDDDSLHRSWRLLAQASLSTLRPPEVPGVDAPPLQDVRQAERGCSRANHPHHFCRCSGTKLKKNANLYKQHFLCSTSVK